MTAYVKLELFLPLGRRYDDYLLGACARREFFVFTFTGQQRIDGVASCAALPKGVKKYAAATVQIDDTQAGLYCYKGIMSDALSSQGLVDPSMRILHPDGVEILGFQRMERGDRTVHQLMDLTNGGDNDDRTPTPGCGAMFNCLFGETNLLKPRTEWHSQHTCTLKGPLVVLWAILGLRTRPEYWRHTLPIIFQGGDWREAATTAGIRRFFTADLGVTAIVTIYKTPGSQPPAELCTLDAGHYWH